MRIGILTFAAFLGFSSVVASAMEPTLPPAPPLPQKANAAVAATKPDAPKPPAVLYAERDVARLKELAAKNEKLAKQLEKAEARLKLLQSDPPAVPDPKAVRAVETFKLDRPGISCRFTSEGDYVFAGSMDSAMHRFDVLTGDRVEFPGHETWVRRFDLHRETGMMVSGSYAGRLYWWNPLDPAPKPLRQVDAHEGYVRGVAISPDGRLVASGGNDNMVRIWSADDGRLIKELAGHERHVYNLRFDPSGKYLVSGDLMGVLKQWETGSWKHVRDLDAKMLTKYDKSFRADCGGIRGMDFSPDGTQLLVSGISNVTNAFAGVGDVTAVLYDFSTGKKLKEMRPTKTKRGTLWGVKWHPSGKFFVGVGGSNTGIMWFWRPDSEKPFHEIKLPGVGYDVCFHPDGLRMAVAAYNKTVVVYDLAPAPAKPKGKGGKSKKPKK